MRERAVLLTLSGLLAGAGCSATSKESLVPPQTVEMDAETLRKFQHEVEEYVELRQKVLTKIPPVTTKATPDQIAAHQKALTEAIVAYRKGAKRGEIFGPEVEAAVRRTLHRAFSAPDGPALIKEIKSDNPTVEGNPSARDPTKEVKQPVTLTVNTFYNSAAPPYVLQWLLIALAAGALVLFPSLAYLYRVFKGSNAIEPKRF